jgi:hypothetical protein
MLEAKGELGSVVESSSALGTAGKIGLTALAAAAVSVGVAAIHMGTEFQTQLTRLYTAAGAPKQVVLDNANAILALGTSVGQTGTAMAEALYHPISAGLDMATALQVVKYAAQEAAISGASLDDTTYSLSSVMKAFNQPASQAENTMASLNAIVGQGDMRFQDFNASVKNWAPTAAQMGISINSMGAGLAYLTDRGNSAEVAATRMTMGISMMTTPSKQAATLLEGLGVASSDVKASTSAMTDVLQKTGITQNKLATDLKQPDGLYVALKDLHDGLQKAGVSGTEADSVLAKIFGGGRSDKAIMSLMQNLDGLKGKFDDISKSSTAKSFEQNWDDARKTFGFQMQQIKAGAENVLTHLGTTLLPKISSLTSSIGSGMGQLFSGFSSGKGMSGMAKLGEALRPIADDFAKFGRDVGTSIGNMVHAVEPAAKVIGVEFFGALKIVGAILANIVGPALKAVSGFFKEHQGIVIALVQLALIPLYARMVALPFKMVSSAVSGLVGTFKGAVDSVKASAKVIGDFGSGVASFASSFASAVSTGAQWVATTVSQFAKVAASAVANAATTTGAWLASTAKMIGQGIAQAAAWSAGLAAKFATAAASAVASAATTSAAWIASAATMTGKVIAQGAVWVAGTLAEYAAVAAGAVVSALATAAAWVAANIAMIAATGGIILLLAAVVLAAIYLATHWKQVCADVKEAISIAAKWIGDRVHDVIGFFEALPGEVGRFFADAGKWLLNAGKAILDGLLNGLKNAWNAVTGFIGGIGNWISSHKGPIETDRQLLVPHGNAIMNGLLEGLQTGGSRVSSYLDNFTAGIGTTSINGSLAVNSSPAVNGGYSGAVTGGSGAPGSVTINITTGALLSTKADIKQAVQEAFLQNGMRNVQNGLTFFAK